MKIIDTFHPVHYESEEIERLGLLKDFSADKYGKGSTKKIYAFKNGYGASVVNGFMTQGLDELAVITFGNNVKFHRARKKRLRKKLFKSLGDYEVVFNTPITDGVKRYTENKDLQQDLSKIEKLKKI
ncbi:hypothetical protein [Bacillus pumilus]|uniref:hypothetical protein n=1 Tax=Bacillus pumilus TaxID=1408 RepID=UPI0011A41433|nr:hypothetical protein [Bacillus pumilus]